MARSSRGATLTDQHGRLQLALRNLTLRQFLLIFPALDFDRLDATWPAVEAALQSLVAARRQDSAGLAARYYREFRAAEGVTGRYQPTLAKPIPARLSAVGLTINGPFAAKHLLSLKDPQAQAKTITHLSGEIGRQVLNGGRDTVLENVARDDLALGWVRDARGANPCAFCVMLASRGPVYDKTSSKFRAHKKCACGSEPVFHRGTEWPSGGRDFRKLWNDTTRGLSGAEARRAFRRAYEGRT